MTKDEAKEKNLPNVLKQIGERYNEKELKAIAEGGRIVPGYCRVPVIDFDGERIRFGYFTDTHFGSIFCNPEFAEKAIAEFKKEKCEFVVHSGDVTEGLSNRAGHMFELSHIGYEAQREHAIEILSEWPGKMYLIDGNHDQWYLMANGARIVRDIAEKLPDAEYVGQDTGDMSLKGFATLKLWHGKTGSSYATSYRLQKIIESLTGGEKPGILCAGHTHKQGYFFDRNIHVISGGCIEKQTDFMRAKNLAAHVGYWIIDVWVNKGGIAKLRCTWYPFYC